MRTPKSGFGFFRMTMLGRILLILLIAGVFPAGCQGGASLSTSQGRKLGSGNQIALGHDVEKAGRYQSNDVVIDYKYVRSGDNMQLSGVLQFATAIQANFVIVRTFQLGLVLADAQGNILGRQGLATSYNDNVGDSISFSSSILVPPQATAMAFSYTGQAYNSGRDSNPTNFWLDPVIK